MKKIIERYPVNSTIIINMSEQIAADRNLFDAQRLAQKWFDSTSVTEKTRDEIKEIYPKLIPENAEEMLGRLEKILQTDERLHPHRPSKEIIIAGFIIGFLRILGSLVKASTEFSPNEYVGTTMFAGTIIILFAIDEIPRYLDDSKNQYFD